jgi:hypothetical protein
MCVCKVSEKGIFFVVYVKRQKKSSEKADFSSEFCLFLHIPHTYLIFNKQLCTHIFVLFFWYFKINLIAFQIKGAYAPGTKNTTPTPL